MGSRGGGGGWLVSFSGMADALGWAPRLPLVAPPDRPRVLAGLGVRELVLPFAAVRGMDPREFLVGVLQRDLGVCGVCCGRNYRFGRGASGDADTLREICVEAGMEPRVLELLAAGEGPITCSPRRAPTCPYTCRRGWVRSPLFPPCGLQEATYQAAG